MNYTIDATDKKLGRVSSEAALMLMGKKIPGFAQNTVANVKVKIVNASKADFNLEKLARDTFKSYSHFPGGYKEVTMERMAEKKGYRELFRKAIYGMLPNNKLRAKVIKNLTVTE